MKKSLTLLFLISLSYSNLYAQAEVCESSKESITDINALNISKCDITENSNNKKAKRLIAVKTKKTKTRFRKIKNSQSNLKSNNSIQLSLNNHTSVIKLPTANKSILFNLVEEVPLFNGCRKASKKENIKCFKSKLNKHISKYFRPEEIIDTNINEKILIQFTIDIYGKTSTIKVNSKLNNKLINKELTKTIKKLPNFSPGKEQGFPVNVTYSFPLNLTLN